MKWIKKTLFMSRYDDHLIFRSIASSFAFLGALVVYFKTQEFSDIWLSISFIWFMVLFGGLIEVIFSKKKNIVLVMRAIWTIGTIIGVLWLIYILASQYI
jgi:hypothetical protein